MVTEEPAPSCVNTRRGLRCNAHVAQKHTHRSPAGRFGRSGIRSRRYREGDFTTVARFLRVTLATKALPPPRHFLRIRARIKRTPPLARMTSPRDATNAHVTFLHRARLIAASFNDARKLRATLPTSSYREKRPHPSPSLPLHER